MRLPDVPDVAEFPSFEDELLSFDEFLRVKTRGTVIAAAITTTRPTSRPVMTHLRRREDLLAMGATA